MQLSEIVTAVEDIVHDSDYTSTIIKSLANEAVLVVATGVLIPGRRQLSPPLPDLYTTSTVTTVLSTGYLSLPADYNRDVIMLVNSDGETITKIDSWLRFMKSSADQAAGTVDRYCVSGSRLHYRDIPAVATNLTAHYYKNPTTLTADADIPSCIPTVLHRDLIVGYVAREIFNKKELGMAGQKVDTANYDNIFNGGILKLVDILPEDGEPIYCDGSSDHIEW